MIDLLGLKNLNKFRNLDAPIATALDYNDVSYV